MHLERISQTVDCLTVDEMLDGGSKNSNFMQT
jgi:hypothetical protein